MLYFGTEIYSSSHASFLSEIFIHKMPVEPFSEEYNIPCHGSTVMKVLYTNMASSVESWLVKAEGVLDASARKIVGLDVE